MFPDEREYRVRTLNEARHLGELLEGIGKQDYDSGNVEVVVVDSGSTDGTIEIARRFDAKLVHIRKDEFSFGRSLNIGCPAASGDALLFISGHSIPANRGWVAELVCPFGHNEIAYTYGRQVGNGITCRFSEKQIFAKYLPENWPHTAGGLLQKQRQLGSAQTCFGESSVRPTADGTGRHLAKQWVQEGYRCEYVAEASAHHFHDETWCLVRRLAFA